MGSPARSTQKLVVALGTAVKPGAFGGGNQFARSLQEYLERQGHKVINHLRSSEIDVIIVTEPRPWSASSAFDIVAALKYRKRSPQTRIIHRINECDQRKGRPAGLHNRLLRQTALQADHVVFVSEWLKNLHQGTEKESWPSATVIRNGADQSVFNPDGRGSWDKKTPLKIVTHHWSNNWHKGWDVYQKLDDLISDGLRGQVAFTYIGNVWSGANLKNTRIIEPKTGLGLAHELKQHHVYITASRSEPGPMHIVEAMQCGLPILFGTSGSLPEYATEFGVPLAGPNDLVAAIERLRGQYDDLVTRTYTYNSEAMVQQWENLILKVQVSKSPTSVFKLVYLRVLQAVLWLRNTLS